MTDTQEQGKDHHHHHIYIYISKYDSRYKRYIV